MPRTPLANHPTKLALLECAAALLETHQLEEISVDLICKTSGIALGSLYHHHKDLPTLLDSALVFRFARYIDRSIEWLNQALNESKTKEEFFVGLKRVTRGTQARDLVNARRERAGTLYRAGSHEIFRQQLGAEQQRLTNELSGIISAAQAKGWVNQTIDAKAGAVLIQAYTLGRIVDDITPAPMDDDKWIELIDRLADLVFGLDG
jgi:AcrR family transcriptional regulator